MEGFSPRKREARHIQPQEIKDIESNISFVVNSAGQTMDVRDTALDARPKSPEKVHKEKGSDFVVDSKGNVKKEDAPTLSLREKLEKLSGKPVSDDVKGKGIRIPKRSFGLGGLDQKSI